MKGLILKDFLVMKKTLRYYVLIGLFYSFLSLANAFTYSIISGFVILAGTMLPMSAFAYDEQARWDKFAVSTPVGRTGVVKARYLFATILLTVGSVIASVLSMAVTHLGKTELSAWWEPIAVTALVCLAGVWLNAVILPLMFKFGTEKSRVISLGLFAAVFGGMALLSLITEKQGFTVPPIFETLFSLPPAVLAAGALVLTVAGFFLSYRVSLGIYKNKEL